jgi:hypothetical protein
MKSARAIAFFVCSLAVSASIAEEPSKVSLIRVPNRGIQPQVMMDGNGVLHMIYFYGRHGGGDIFYVRSRDAGNRFSEPIRVNSQSESVIATGNIRGAQLAIGKNGRVHVAWMGSSKAEPRGPDKALPMLYTRLNDEGTAFEPQRNLIQSAYGLDGGGSLAADETGNVEVAWHAPESGLEGEGNRRVWIVRSRDEGKTFTPEKAISDGRTGCCGCCGMRAFAARNGGVYILYRSAAQKIHRDTYLLSAKNLNGKFQSERLDTWEVANCPMSSFALTESGGKILAAWESDGQVRFTHIDPATGKHAEPISAPGSRGGRKHPVIAGNANGMTILVWTEGMGWNRGGSVAWQVFDKEGRPTAEKGQANGVPAWSLVAVFTRPDGGFTIIY